MKLALIGATGFVGGALLAEALKRGHDVTALARTPAKIAAQPRLAVTQADVLDAAQVAAAVAGHDAVLSAYNPCFTSATAISSARQAAARPALSPSKQNTTSPTRRKMRCRCSGVVDVPSVATA